MLRQEAIDLRNVTVSKWALVFQNGNLTMNSKAASIHVLSIANHIQNPSLQLHIVFNATEIIKLSIK